MASNEEFVKYVAEQMRDAGTITYRKMFGEYGLYCNGKYFALVCDNELYVKTTPEGQELLESPELAPPYPGAKPCFLITNLEDTALLAQLTITTCNALPEAKPKKKGK